MARPSLTAGCIIALALVSVVLAQDYWLMSADQPRNKYFAVDSDDIPVVKVPRKLINVDYIGLGYDAVIGNPFTDLRDPGFVQPVFNLTYKDKIVSADGRWLIPDGVQAQQTIGCSYVSVLSIRSTIEYQRAMSVDAKVEAGYGGKVFGFSFSASAGYNEVHAGTSLSEKVYVLSEATCLVYEVAIKEMAGPQVTNDFAAAVSALPLQSTGQNATPYIQFITTYGTHYAHKLDMGARAVLMSEFTKTALSTMESSGTSIQAAARASFLCAVFGGASVKTEMQRKQAEAFESTRSSVQASYLGSRPSSDGKWESWAQRTAQSPYPVKYVLRPITELFIPRLFPDHDAQLLGIKKRNLENFYDVYANGRVVNKALKQQVSQETTYLNASCATDGDHTSHSCTNVRVSGYPWIQINLGAEYHVDTVIIYPSSQSVRMVDIVVSINNESVSQSAPNYKNNRMPCAMYPGSFTGRRYIALGCPSTMPAVRYVVVQGSGERLCVAEVEVYTRENPFRVPR